MWKSKKSALRKDMLPSYWLTENEIVELPDGRSYMLSDLKYYLKAIQRGWHLDESTLKMWKEFAEFGISHSNGYVAKTSQFLLNHLKKYKAGDFKSWKLEATD